jgi:hypothetical protein
VFASVLIVVLTGDATSLILISSFNFLITTPFSPY